jgi:ubiquinol-cytochrome c reductase cytochrome c subunit
MTREHRTRTRLAAGTFAIALVAFGVQQLAAGPSSSARAVNSAANPSAAAPADTTPPNPALVHQGRELFLLTCSSCHGTDGRGVVGGDLQRRGPSLMNVGTSAASYQLRTGRMPLADSQLPAVNKPSPFNAQQIDALIAYVGTFGPGPQGTPIDLRHANVAMGGELYRANCAACHNAAGAGGALSYGRAAPSLIGVAPQVVGLAVRVGPGQMPTFSRQELSDAQVNDIAGYVHYLKTPNDRGGLSLGRFGPVPEGFAIWVLGLGVLLLSTVWISKRVHQYHAKGER